MWYGISLREKKTSEELRDRMKKQVEVVWSSGLR